MEQVHVAPKTDLGEMNAVELGAFASGRASPVEAAQAALAHSSTWV